jgi:hypothetical protein
MAKKTPEIKPEGFGLSSKGDGRTPQIRHNRPEVARHWARLIVACNMDAEAAVAKGLATEYPDATDAQIVSLARTLQASPHIQREMAAILEEIGIGDKALKKLIGGLWAEFLGQNDKRWAAAARLLSEITGAGKATEKDKKLPTLKLAGMEAGLEQMLGNAAPTNVIDEDVEITDDADVAE